MKKLRQQKGAAIVWAVSSMLILAILITAMMSVALAYSNRSLRDETSRQAYLTARAAVDTVLSKVDGYQTQLVALQQDALGNVEYDSEGNPLMRTITEDEIWASLDEDFILPRSGTVTLTGFEALGAADMGSLDSVTITRENASAWHISATATYQGDQETVGATVGLTRSTGSVELPGLAQRTPVSEIFHGFLANYLKLPTGGLFIGDTYFRLKDCNLYFWTIDDPGSLFTGKAFRRLTMVNSGQKVYTNQSLVESGSDIGIGSFFWFPILGADGVVANAAEYYGRIPSYPAVFIPREGLKDNKSQYAGQGSTVTVTRVDGGTTTPTGSGEAFYQVFSSASFNLSGAGSKAVYIFLEPGATLNITAYHGGSGQLYVYGGEGSTVNFNNIGSGKTINGSVTGANVVFNGNRACTINFNYTAPSSTAQIAFAADPSRPAIVVEGYDISRWSLTRYD